jgi:DeoD family purine-nucleoside phosphorylase
MYHIRCRAGDIAERVITCGDPGRVEKLARLMEGAELVNSHRGLLVYTGAYNGVRVTVATTGMGAPSAAIVNEELAMLGAKAIIRVGTTGAISRRVSLGDIVVPTEAIPLDGATKAYMKEGGKPLADSGIVEALVRELGERGVKCVVGRICTSDTFYLEEEIEAKKWAEQGALSFEMECSVTFAVGSIRGYRSGAVLVVTGRIQGLKDRILDTDSTEASISVAISSALEAISLLEV